MTATLTPAVQDLYSRFAKLSQQEQESFRAKLAGQGEPEIPDWQWEVLMERETLAAQGLDQPIPWEDAKRELRKKWGDR